MLTIQRFYLFVLLNLLGNSIFPQTFSWVKTFDHANWEGYQMVVDAQRNVYVSGKFSTLTDFDPGPGTFYMFAGATDMFITKLDSSGNFIWAKQIAGINSSWLEVSELIVDPSGNLLICGQFMGVFDFDPGVNAFTVTSNSGTPDGFVVKLDMFGDFVWEKTFGGNFLEAAHTLISSSLCDVIVTGYFQSSIADLDPGPGTFTVASGGGRAGFIVKLDSLGNFQWGKILTGVGTVALGTIALSSTGRITIGGYFQNMDSLDVDPSSAMHFIKRNTLIQSFVLNLSGNGNYLWVAEFNSTHTLLFSAVKTDGTGNIYLAGNFIDTCDFDPGPQIYNVTTPTVDYDTFILKLDSMSNFQWLQTITGGVNQIIADMSIDNSGVLYVCGWLVGITTFSNNITYLLNTKGDAFLAKYDLSGNYKWSGLFSGTNGDLASSMSIDPIGSIYVTGNFGSSDTDFDPGFGKVNGNFSPINNSFIVKLWPSCTAPANAVNITPEINQNVCATSQTTLIAQGLGAYQWYANASGTLVIGEYQNLIVIPMTAGTHTYFVQMGKCALSSSLTPVTLNADPCTGINSPSYEEPTFSVFPNPNDGKFMLNVIEEADLSIYDVDSKLKYSKVISAGLNAFTIDFPSGVYFVVCKSQGISKTFKLIIQ